MAEPHHTDETQVDAATPKPVPSLVSASVLLERLRACELLDANQWTEAAAAPAATLSDARVLARGLIQRGWLTPFQLNQLFLDRGQQLVLESYLLLERLGEGGMGQVFKARHRKLGHFVAVKVIRKDRLLNPDMVKRFQREIRTTSQLSHPNIVRALDAGEGAGGYYFAMEFIDGVDLSKLVRRLGMLPPREACEYIRQAAIGLHHAHVSGIVHRDIKPSNLLRRTGEPPVVMVLDLGLARRLDREGAEASTTLTDEGAVMGTPDYIAPEQAEESHTVDARADVYSLGCTFYYLLNGKPPFVGGSLATKLRRHMMTEPTPIEQVRDDLPPGLAFVVRKMMAKRPEDRYQTAAAVAEALEAVFKDVPMALPLAETITAPSATPVETPLILLPSSDKTVTLPSTLPWRRKPSWTLLGLGAAGVGLVSAMLLVAIVALLLLSRHPQASTSPPTSPPPPLAEWEVALNKLRERADKQDENRDALFEDVLKFQQKYNREPNALLGGAGLLHALPSPLDKLDVKAIPKEERYPWQPPELVAIVGSHRFRHWTPTNALVWDESNAAPISADANNLYFWDANGRLLKAEKAEIRREGLTMPAGNPKMLASLGRDGSVQLWKRGDKGFEVWHNLGPGYNGRIALTREGTLLAVGANTSVALWDLTGAEPKRLPNVGAVSDKSVLYVAIHPDGKWLAASDTEGRIKLWGQQEGVWKAVLPLPPEFIAGNNNEAYLRSFDFQPDGNLFVVCTNGGGYVFRWDLSESPPKRLKDFAFRQSGGSLAFTADGKTLVMVWSFEPYANYDFWTDLTAPEPKLVRRTSCHTLGRTRSSSFPKIRKPCASHTRIPVTTTTMCICHTKLR